MSALPTNGTAVPTTNVAHQVATAEKVVVIEGPTEETTPEHLRAYAELLNMVLTSPLASKAVETWGQVQVAQLAAQKEAAQQQAANADAAHKRQSEVAVAFLTRLAVLGVAGMGCLGFFAYAKILDGQDRKSVV